MGLMGKMGLGGGSRGSTQNKFMKVLDRVDLGCTDAVDPVVPTGAWTKLGAGFVVPAQQMIHLGF